MSEAAAPIEVFNRYTRAVEHEAVYGERWLRWTYGTISGGLALRLIAKRVWFSRWYGWRMSRPVSARLIPDFVARYGIDTSAFAVPVEGFRSFNEFFSRALKPGLRPVCGDADAVVFPADGRHLGFASIGAADRIYVKGQSLDLAALFADRALAQRFADGAVVISRLCPVDYHRFHFPCGGRYHGARIVPGPLCSVSPIALRRRVEYLTTNKRSISLIEETPAGMVAMVEVGATCVGSIVQMARPGVVAKGGEKGMFRFGGSCVITLFESGRVVLDDDLLAQTARGRELYARMGDRMGRIVAH